MVYVGSVFGFSAVGLPLMYEGGLISEGYPQIIQGAFLRKLPVTLEGKGCERQYINTGWFKLTREGWYLWDS